MGHGGRRLHCASKQRPRPSACTAPTPTNTYALPCHALQSPILFVAKHTTPDVFEDGACKINKPVGAQAAPEERVLFQGGPDLRFESVDEFLRAIKAGAALFGPDVAAALTTPAPQVQQRAAPTAAQALAQPALQQKAAPVPAGVGLGSEFGGLEALLQSVGWQVVMKQTPADQAAAAPLAAPAGHA